jgi:hypothetical protein
MITNFDAAPSIREAIQLGGCSDGAAADSRETKSGYSRQNGRIE